MASADERHHELPFASFDGREPDGRIDLLFRRGAAWTLSVIPILEASVNTSRQH